MNNLKEKDLFKLLKFKVNDFEKLEIDEEFEEYYINHLKSIKAINDSFKRNNLEFIESNRKSPDWINVLYFQKNLEKCINCLTDYENLLNIELDLLDFDLENLYYDNEYISNDDILNKKNKIIASSSLDEHRTTINSRKSMKFIDLIEYFIAVLKGMDYLFTKKGKGNENYYINRLDHINTINAMRNELRSILKLYQQKQRKFQTTIISVSLTSQKDSKGTFVCQDIKPISKRANLVTPIEEIHIDPKNKNKGLKPFKINLKELDILKSIPKHRIIQVGIKVVDSNSVKKPEEIKNFFRPTWSFKFKSDKTHFKITDTDKHLIFDTIFSNISGEKDAPIIWSNNESLINLNMDRDWSIQFLDYNTLSKTHYRVQDIILNFEVVFEPNNMMI